ncbi:MAG: hypothetical protein VX517_01375 [Candidatus Neomarinimicrobiota bacterium]|jgi:hypothetical protein|nr:hypothetical protein [Candidatus Neomarinimicrobiota bacterium]|tara:strand:+ start:315 stop:722 length:408 start_codon:yes stop_codon:yes gene_type:complete
MLEGIICPACEAPLEEVDIRESLTCKNCKTDLQDRRFLDFLEFLMANGMVEDLDFFDQKVYSEDVERLEPDDEEDVDPNDFEKKKDIFSLYESEMEMYKQKAEDEEIKGYEDFEGIEEEWEDFNKRGSKKSDSEK